MTEWYEYCNATRALTRGTYSLSDVSRVVRQGSGWGSRPAGAPATDDVITWRRYRTAAEAAWDAGEDWRWRNPADEAAAFSVARDYPAAADA
jgi:hypothetical protein